MNTQINVCYLFLKNDVIVMINKINHSLNIVPDLKRKNLNIRHGGVHNLYFKKITENLNNQKSLKIIIFQHLKRERNQPPINYLMDFLRKWIFLIYVDFSFFFKKTIILLVQIYFKMKNEKFNQSDFEFFRAHYLYLNFDKNSICEIKDDLYMVKKIFSAFSFEGFNWFLIFENSRKSKGFFLPEKVYRIILLTIKFSKKLTNSFKKSMFYLFCTEKPHFYYSGEKNFPKLKKNFICDKNSIKVKKTSSRKKNFNAFTCKFFFLIFWKSEWNLEILRYLKNLKVSKWTFQKIIKLNENLLFQRYILKKGQIFVRKQNFFFSFIKKLGTLIQEFPHSIILKARFLCQIVLKQKFRKNGLNLRLWIKDVQNSSHFNHLSFLLLLTDFILSGPKTKNIVMSMISLIQKSLFMLKDLVKIPHKAEKYLDKEFLKKTTIPLSSPFFFIENGLLDLGRKYILKSILYSNVKSQGIFFKYFIESESKTLFFYLLSKISNSPNIFNGKNFEIRKIVKILEQNGRWGLLYRVMYENFQKKKIKILEEKIKI